jgi:hypothetical protein
MQREIAWMALKQAWTLWIIAITGIFVAALVSLYKFGLHRSTWVDLPAYVGCALFFPLVAMADALPPKLRLPVLRFLGPFASGAAASVALVLRLPTAEGTPGKLIWTVMGTDTVMNLEALTYSATVLTVLLAEGVLSSWVSPNRLAFIQTSLDLRPDLVRHFSSDGLELITENVHLIDLDALEPPSSIDLPPDVVDVGHDEDAPDNRTPHGLLAAVAERLDAVGVELAATYAAASGAERQQVGEWIHIRLRELHVQCAHASQEEDNQLSPDSHADASVGTDDAEVGTPECLVRRCTTVGNVLAALDSGIASSMVVKLAPSDDPRTFDVHNNVARMVCGRSAAALVIRLR